MTDSLNVLLQDVEESSSTLYRLLSPHWNLIVQLLPLNAQQLLQHEWKRLKQWRDPPLFMLQLIVDYLILSEVLQMYHLCHTWKKGLKQCKWNSCTLTLSDAHFWVSWNTHFQLICASSIKTCFTKLCIPRNMVVHNQGKFDSFISCDRSIYKEMRPLIPFLTSVHTLIIDEPNSPYDVLLFEFLQEFPQLINLKLLGGYGNAYYYSPPNFDSILQTLPRVSRITLDTRVKLRPNADPHDQLGHEFRRSVDLKKHLELLSSRGHSWKSLELILDELHAEEVCELLQKQADIEQLKLTNLRLSAVYFADQYANISTWNNLLPAIGQMTTLETLWLDGFVINPFLIQSMPDFWSSFFTPRLANTLRHLDLSLGFGNTKFVLHTVFAKVPCTFHHLHTLKVPINERESVGVIVQYFPNVQHLQLKYSNNQSNTMDVKNLSFSDLILLQTLVRLQWLEIEMNLLLALNQTHSTCLEENELNALQSMNQTRINAFLQQHCTPATAVAVNHNGIKDLLQRLTQRRSD